MKRSKITLLIPLLGLALFYLGCGDPEITGLSPSQGIPHTLVQTSGDNIFARTLWDAGSPTPDTLRGLFLSARYFSVPDGEAAGNYDVKFVRNSSVSPSPQAFTVIDPGATAWPDPVLTYIMGFWSQKVGTDSVDMLLFAQGPNVDVHADLQVNGAVVPTSTWAASKNDLAGIDSTTYKMPIYHVTMLFAPIRAKIGATLSIAIINDGGAMSASKNYLVQDSLNWDSDSDGMLDIWEKEGYDADGDGVADTDLPGMGVDPYIMDMMVEADFMDDDGVGGPQIIPTGDPWTLVEEAFRAAPVLNIAGGYQGIQIHIDRGNTEFVGLDGDTITLPAAEIKGGTILTYAAYIREDNAVSPCGAGATNFYNYKKNVTVLAPATENFDSAGRFPFFHYCVFADHHGHSCGSTGRGEIGGNDFWVSEFNTIADLANDVDIANTFMHELGHNLTFLHGGSQVFTYKPNFNSIMNYRYQLAGIDNNCDGSGNNICSYSWGMMQDLDETNLNENLGTCDNHALDWNSNGIMEVGVAVSVNGDGTQNTLTDFFEWGTVQFNFRSDGDYND